MSSPKIPSPAKCFQSVIYRDDDDFDLVCTDLSSTLGSFDIISPVFPFDHTDYYTAEHGTDLKRRFITIDSLFEREMMSSVKQETNKLELKYPNGHQGRRLNIDPGFLTLENVILMTGKGYTHRIYLGRGIYADLTLLYQQGSYVPLPWTYPDYQDPDIISFFNTTRSNYLHQLRSKR